MSGEGETISAEQYRAMQPVKRSKFGNVKTEVDGIRFDSKAEARRYSELKLLESAGEIWGLIRQPRFDLVVEGAKIGTYVADFHYYEKDHWTRVIEDVKSPATKTPLYRLKKRLVKALYGIDVTEVEP